MKGGSHLFDRALIPGLAVAQQLTMASFRAKKDKHTEQTSHSKLQMSMKRAFICVSGLRPLTTGIFNG